MITKNLNLKRRSTHCVLSFILQRCRFENSNVVKIEQTYIAQETLYSRQTVSTELKYLQEEGYITYKRALFNNLTTTEITLTDKSITILNAEASKTSNKPQNKAIKTEEKPQAEAEKTPQQGPKQAKTEQPQKVHDSETEQTEEQAFQTEIEKMNAMYRSLNNIQKGCATALKRAKTDNPVIYVRDAQEQGVPQVLIDFILTYNKMKREEQKYENF